MHPLSIQTRLNVLIGTLLVLALATNVLVIIWSAGPRIRAENDSILKLTRQTVDRALVEVQTSVDPARDIAALLDRLAHVRHARVYFVPSGSDMATVQRIPSDQHVPSWFARHIATDRPPMNVAVSVAGRALGQISIVSTPADEISEIWDAVTETATGGLVLIMAVFALTTLAVRRALQPIAELGAALATMQSGNYGVDVPTTGAPELADISGKVNALAATLARTRRDNSRLAEQMITLEDRERRELARELHDEFGPYLFAIRATLTSLLTRAAGSDSALATEVRTKGSAVLEHVSAVQQLNRRVLQRLRPPALAELGLAGALQGLVALASESHPDVEIVLDVHVETVVLPETMQLTVYRVVQEGITNALRHARARRVTVTVDTTSPGVLGVHVEDDGQGAADGLKAGFGLSGMRERVWALGGTLEMRNRPHGGLMLEVRLPLASVVDTRTQ
jgi:two-component system, NarL family, sensor histidine kinase UhpB